MAHLVLVVVMLKIHWKASALAGTKQSRQAIKADRLTRLVGWRGSRACLLCFVPITSTHVSLKWMFHKFTFVEQSTSLRYLWLAQQWPLPRTSQGLLISLGQVKRAWSVDTLDFPNKNKKNKSLEVKKWSGNCSQNFSVSFGNLGVFLPVWPENWIKFCPILGKKLPKSLNIYIKA